MPDMRCHLQAANFLFGAAAEPHDMLHEPLFRILAAGLATAGVVSLALRVRPHAPTRLLECYQGISCSCLCVPCCSAS